MAWERLEEGPEDPLTDDLDADVLLSDRASAHRWREHCCGQGFFTNCAASKQRYWIVAFVSTLLLVSLIPVVLVIHTHGAGSGGTVIKNAALPEPTPTPFLEPFDFDNNSSSSFSPPEYYPMVDFVFDYIRLLEYSDNSSTTAGVNASAPLEATIFYESLDIPSREFLAHKFFPTYFGQANGTRPRISPKLVPFGHAQFEAGQENGTEKVICEHFQDECQGNLIQACAIRRTKWNDTQSVDKVMRFIRCLMADTGKGGEILELRSDPIGVKCAATTGFNWDSVYNCTRSSEGIAILRMFQKKTVAVLNQSRNSTASTATASSFLLPIVQVKGYGILTEAEKNDFPHFIQSRLESSTGQH